MNATGVAEPAVPDTVARRVRGERPRASRLRFADVLAVGSVGMRTRKLRTALTATGIAKEEVESVLTAPPLVVGNLLDSIPNGHPREAVMRDVLRMVFSDGVLEAEEFDLLERIAQRLELDEETVDRLRQEVSDE